MSCIERQDSGLFAISLLISLTFERRFKTPLYTRSYIAKTRVVVYYILYGYPETFHTSTTSWESAER